MPMVMLVLSMAIQFSTAVLALLWIRQTQRFRAWFFVAVLELAKTAPKARVVVAGGYSSNPVPADCGKHGFAAGLAKPFSSKAPAEVLSRVPAR